MAYIYMTQSIVTLFSQAMVNNALFQYPEKGEGFSKTLSAGLVYLIALSGFLSIVFFFSKGHLINFFKIQDEAKVFALDYLNYMIPFLMIYAISQYYMYIAYALNRAYLNIFYMMGIIVLNCIFNYVAYIFGFGVKGIAIAGGLAILSIMPYYIYFTKKHRIRISFLHLKFYYSKAFSGIKKLGFASILEPATHQYIQFFITIILAKIGGEFLSAKYHAKNFLLFVTALSLAFGVILQMNVARMYGLKKYEETKNLYKKYLRYSVIASIILTLISIGVIFPLIGGVSTSLKVQKYIIIAMLLGFLMEPARALSIVSKSYLKGMQIANLPLILSILNKVLISLPLYYVVLKFTSLGLVGVLLVEIFGYFMNFVFYQIIINFYIRIYKIC